MGFFDRLFGSRAEAAEETRFSGEKMVVKAPIDGIVLPLEQLPGRDLRLRPSSAPAAASSRPVTRSSLPSTGRVALQWPPPSMPSGWKATEGIELLIHIGMDTITLRGSGFTLARPERARPSGRARPCCG